ncbi:MAG: hypothetical protein ABL893_12480 [Hyphomicrobium sp.]
MSERSPKRGFAARPADPESWIKASAAPASRGADANQYTARLTIDVTPELRARIKIAAFKNGVTVADMLRDLLRDQFPPIEGDTP